MIRNRGGRNRIRHSCSLHCHVRGQLKRSNLEIERPTAPSLELSSTSRREPFYHHDDFLSTPMNPWPLPLAFPGPLRVPLAA